MSALYLLLETARNLLECCPKSGILALLRKAVPSRTVGLAPSGNSVKIDSLVNCFFCTAKYVDQCFRMRKAHFCRWFCLKLTPFHHKIQPKVPKVAFLPQILRKSITSTTPPSPPSFAHRACILHGHGRRQSTETHPHTLPAQRKTEAKYRRKKQRIRHIKQGLDGNWTEIGRPKVTYRDYNTVAPFYIIIKVMPDATNAQCISF